MSSSGADRSVEVSSDAVAGHSVLDTLLAGSGPFIDLRSAREFATGAVPGAINLPILNDDERHQVGLTYKHEGQAGAIALGESLVAGTTREARLTGWLDFVRGHDGVWLYCWRGGLRSETAQRWLAEAGVALPRVPGGFKALRHRCLEILEQAPGEKPWYILGGRTGTGKTVVLNRLPAGIDLEGLANHRGSAFGAALTPQPSPIGFENALAVACLCHQEPLVILEDESRTIGRLAIPEAWHETMQRSPLIILEADLESRARHIRTEYVWQPLAHGVAASTLLQQLQDALERIGKRLGGVRKKTVANSLEKGFDHGDHLDWIQQLLEYYYDPMYDYQLEKKLDRVIFKGTADETEDFLRDLETPPQ